MSSRAHAPSDGGPAVDRLPVAVVEFTAGDGVTTVNREWVSLTGVRAAASLGDGWLGALCPEHRALALDQLERAAAGESTSGEWRLLHPTGGAGRWVGVRARQDLGVGTSACVAVVIDISGEKARERELRHRATHDELTGLLTKAVFMAGVDHALARHRRQRGGVAVLFVDLDRFKAINDHYGHALGDGVLAESARRVRRSVRPSDSVGRVGGDEFAVLCEDLTERDDAVRVAERILRASSIALRASSRVAVPDVSIGIAYAAGDSDTAEHLLNRADQAMYRAKQLGRRRYAIFDGGSAAPPRFTGRDRSSGQPDWRRSRDEIMTHICNSVILLTGGQNEDGAFAQRVHPAVVELDAALSGLQMVDPVVTAPDPGGAPVVGSEPSPAVPGLPPV